MIANSGGPVRGRWPLAVLLVMLGFAVTAHPVLTAAECPPPPTTSPLEAGEVGLFFDAEGLLTCAEVPIGVFVPVYLVGRVPAGGVASYSVSELLTSAGVVVTSGSLPPGAPFNLEILVDACNTAERIDPESCPTDEQELIVLAVYNVMFFTMSGTVCFQTACPTIAGVVLMNPWYTRCDTGEWADFTGGESMCLGLGQAPVPTDGNTWGKIKSLYGGN